MEKIVAGEMVHASDTGKLERSNMTRASQLRKKVFWSSHGFIFQNAA
jgi:hypothetical protein